MCRNKLYQQHNNILDDEEQVHEEVEEGGEEEKDVCAKLAEKKRHYQKFVDRLSLDEDDLDILYVARKRIKQIETKERAEMVFKQAWIIDFTN